MRAAGEPPNATPLLNIPTPPFGASEAYTILLYGGQGREPLQAMVQEDVPVDSDSSRNTLRFFNAMQGAPALELCRLRGPTNRTPVFSGASVGNYGAPHFRPNARHVDAMTNAAEVVSNGRVELEVRIAGRTLCSGTKLGTARFVASSGLNGTVVAVGNYRSPRTRELFMCADAPSDTNCITVALDGH